MRRSGMDPSLGSNKIPLDGDGSEVVRRFARWLRIVGSAQLGIASVALALVGLAVLCSMAAAGAAGGFALIGSMVPLVILGVVVLQALRLQAAGEQFAEVANEGDIDSLEFGFARLKTVFVIDVVIGALMLVMQLFGAMK